MSILAAPRCAPDQAAGLGARGEEGAGSGPRAPQPAGGPSESPCPRPHFVTAREEETWTRSGSRARLTRGLRIGTAEPGHRPRQRKRLQDNAQQGRMGSAVRNPEVLQSFWDRAAMRPDEITLARVSHAKIAWARRGVPTRLADRRDRQPSTRPAFASRAGTGGVAGEARELRTKRGPLSILIEARGEGSCRLFGSAAPAGGSDDAN